MKPRDVGLVILWMAGALASFSAVAVAIRTLARTLSLFELLAMRNAGGLAILGLAVLVRPAFRHDLALRRPALQLVRNVAHFGGQYAWAFGVTALPLATAFALEFTAPAWLAALAVPLLGERLTPSRVGAVALGLVGVLVILRPGSESMQPAAFVMLAAAFLFAVTATATKALTRDVSTFTILFWMNAIQLVFNLVGSDPHFPTRITAAQWPAALVIVAGGLASHLCLTQAYRSGDATVVMPLDFLRIPAIALIGWLLYAEPLDGLVFAGAALIVAGILWNLVSESRRPSHRPSGTRSPQAEARERSGPLQE